MNESTSGVRPHTSPHRPIVARAWRASRPVSLLSCCVLAIACGGPPRGVRHAQKLLEKGDYAAAERAAESELTRFPKHPVLWRIKIQAPLERGQPARAVARYKEWHHLRKHYDNAAMRVMAIATIDHALRSSSVSVRRAAVRAVAAIPARRLRASLHRLLADPDPTVTVAAASVLATDSRQAVAVLERLVSSSDARARAAAVLGLGKTLRRRAVAIAALADKDARVRRAGVLALARFGAGERARLLALATSDPDGSVRATALGALATGPFEGIVGVAQKALADKYVGARLAGIRLLGHGGAAARPILLELTRSADVFVALRAAVTLALAGGERRPDTIERALNSAEWTIRAAALNALAEVVDTNEAIRLATRAASDGRAEVRLTAGRALARLGRAGAALGVFEAALADSREAIRVRAAIQLLRIDEGSGRRALAKLLASRQTATRMAAVRAYAGAQNATLTLVGALADEAAEVRVVAAASLYRLLK